MRIIFILSLFFTLSTMAFGQVSDEPLNTDFDVNFYHIGLYVAIDSPYISGKVKVVFTANKNLNEITLDLAKGFRLPKVEGAKTYNYSKNKLVIQLSKSVKKDQQGQVTVSYRGKPPIATDGVVKKGLLYKKHGKNKDEPIIVNLSTPYLAHYWFPCKDGPGDKADSVYIDVTIKDTVINEIPVVVASNGMLEGERKNAGRGTKTFSWRHRYPIVPYYVVVAISNYKKEVVDYVGPKGEKYPLEFYVFKEHLKKAKTTINRLPDILTYLSQTFGTYPFAKEKYGMAQLGFYSGIEKQTMAIVNNMSGRSMSTTVHEAAHMWLGNSVTCADWHHAWLNEGMARYAEAMWQEFRRGQDVYNQKIKKSEYFKDGSVFIKDIDNPFAVFKPIVYNKGSYVIHMLRHVMTDRYFFKAMKMWGSDGRYKYKHATTEDFQAICEYQSGKDLEYFFKEWIYGENYPVYDYAFTQKGSDFSFWINQKEWETTPSFFIMPLDIQFTFEDGSTVLKNVMNDLPNQEFKFKFDKEVIDIEIDPEKWVLKKVRYGNKVINTKSPIKDLDVNVSSTGRKLNLSYSIDSKQALEIELIDKEGNSVYKNSLKKAVGVIEKEVRFEDGKVDDGKYTLYITGKSDRFFMPIKLK